jgi:hypothetical protein
VSQLWKAFGMCRDPKESRPSTVRTGDLGVDRRGELLVLAPKVTTFRGGVAGCEGSEATSA